MKYRSLNVEVLANIIVGNKPMQLSRRVIGNNVKCYLHFPLQVVTCKNEISKDLFLMIYNNNK